MRLLVISLVFYLVGAFVQAETSQTNLALFATLRTSYVQGHETLEAIQNGFDPATRPPKSGQ